MLKTTTLIGGLFATLLCCAAHLNLPPEQVVVRHEAHDKPKNSIYHWMTTFSPTQQVLDFVAEHNIERIYMRMFDVDLIYNENTGESNIEPVATIRFKGEVPSGVEIVPTTYITYEALANLCYHEEEYAELIVERILAMANYNNCGEIGEVQFDCDWTENTRKTYFKLLEHARGLLQEYGITLSATIRLHQLDEEAPPVERGVLMLYNTGNFRDIETENSILDVSDVKPYLRVKGYPLPLDYAYPTYGWSVSFYDGEFDSLVAGTEYEPQLSLEHVRHERPSVATILEVKRMTEEALGKPYQSNILYHLDESQLKYYSNDEITEILSRD